MSIDLLDKHAHEVRFALRLKHKDLNLYVGREGLIELRHRALIFECKRYMPDFDEIVNTLSESAEWLHNTPPLAEHRFEIESELANGN